MENNKDVFIQNEISNYEILKNKPWPTLINNNIFRVIAGEQIKNPPVWVMRQAGRYLPEFREIRKHADFFTIVQTPQLACTITLQPIERYHMDAAIIFSDILILCQAVGMNVQMLPGIGPHISNILQSPDDLQNLNFEFDPEIYFNYLKQSICLTRHTLNGQCPLIGFAGGPWTLMAYMTDNSNVGSTRTFKSSRRWLYQYETQSLQLLGLLSDAIIKLLICQYEAGAQILMVFESHADILNYDLFKKYSFPFLNLIVSKVKSTIGNHVPIIIFAKGAHYAIEDLIKSEFDVITLDWTIVVDKNLINLANQYKKTLMGNLDPACLYSSTDEQLIEHTKNMLKSFKDVRYIANLGHGIYPDIDPEKLALFVETIKQEHY